jgi:hypothetical protein
MKNHPNFKVISLLLIILFFCSSKGICQSSKDMMGTIITTGNNATGSSGTVAYSIGQIFYTYIGESFYGVAQGIQHEETSDAFSEPLDNIEPKAEIVVFPNPTTDFVNITMEGYEAESGQRSYQIFDIQGRVVKQNSIDQNETQISLNDLSASIYLLQVSINNKVLKTFKILKK